MTLRATGAVSVAISTLKRSLPVMCSVPSTRTSAASSAFGQQARFGTTRESSSLTSEVNDTSSRASQPLLVAVDVAVPDRHVVAELAQVAPCLLYTSPSPRD